MPERSDALKKAQQKYMEKFAVARIRMEREKYEFVQRYAEKKGMSVNALVVALLDQAISQDNSGAISQTAGGPQEANPGILTPSTLKAAQEAAEAAGEAVPQFIARAVETQAQRDIMSRRMGVNPATGGKLEREA